MKREEKVQVMSIYNDTVLDVAPREVSLEDNGCIHVELGRGRAIEFKGNAMIETIMTLLLDEKGEDYGTED